MSGIFTWTSSCRGFFLQFFRKFLQNFSYDFPKILSETLSGLSSVITPKSSSWIPLRYLLLKFAIGIYPGIHPVIPPRKSIRIILDILHEFSLGIHSGFLKALLQSIFHSGIFPITYSRLWTHLFILQIIYPELLWISFRSSVQAFSLNCFLDLT